ncbi:MAG: hypothetical protein ACWGOX_12035, partial [Desulforhopalus sp.]
LISIILLFIASAFTAMSASAACTAEEKAALTCADIGDYALRISNDIFPVQDDIYSIFEYTLDGSATTKNVSIIDMLVPVCSDENFLYDDALIATGPASGWTFYEDGDGSPSTNFGTGVLQYATFERNFDKSTFDLTTYKASAGPTTVGFKIGSKLYVGEILGPACYRPQMGTVTFQVITLNEDKKVRVTKDPTGEVTGVAFSCGVDAEGQDIWCPADLEEAVKLYACANFDTYGACTDTQQVSYMPEGVVKIGTNTTVCYRTLAGSLYCYRY